MTPVTPVTPGTDELLDRAVRAYRSDDDEVAPWAAARSRAAIMGDLARRGRRRRAFFLVAVSLLGLGGSTALAWSTGALTPVFDRVFRGASVDGGEGVEGAQNGEHTYREPRADSTADGPATAPTPRSTVPGALSAAPMDSSSPEVELPVAPVAPVVPAVAREPREPTGHQPAVVGAVPAAPVPSAPRGTSDHSPRESPTATTAPGAAGPSAEAAESVSVEHARFREALSIHQGDSSPGSRSFAALRAWDAYLASHPGGRYEPEARFHRALALLRLGREAAALEALTPFADGRFDGYRQADARALVNRLEARRQIDRSGGAAAD